MEAWPIARAALILGGVGLTFGMLIAVAHRVFWVWEDPRILGTVELLPGSNCGACGYAGCQPFAQGLVAGETPPSACTQMTPDAIEAVAAYLGVEAGEATKRVARLLCAGGWDVAIKRSEYRGIESCAAAAAVSGGEKGCSWGCLGLADCEVACDYDAIWMDRFGLPHVIPERCTACNDCVEACPKNLFSIMPMDRHLIVQCRCELEGEAATDLCRVACNGCRRCVADAAEGVISMRGGLAVVNDDASDRAGPEATARCPTGAIVWVEGTQLAGAAEAPGTEDIEATSPETASPEAPSSETPSPEATGPEATNPKIPVAAGAPAETTRR